MSHITLEQAQNIAALEIERRKNVPRLTGYDFSPAELVRDDGLTWTFVSSSQKLQEEGCVPGAIFVRVDKRDGHIWTNDEIEQYSASLAAQRAQSSARGACTIFTPAFHPFAQPHSFTQ